jgi:hypothetical protein
MKEPEEILVCVGAEEWAEHGHEYRQLFADVTGATVVGWVEGAAYRADWLQPLGDIAVVIVLTKGAIAGAGEALGKLAVNRVADLLKGRPRTCTGKRKVVLHGPRPGQILSEVTVCDEQSQTMPNDAFPPLE